jgi:plasmid maintenance system antidote protein VapI
MKTKKRNIRTLAEAAGYTPAMLSHIINGIRTPRLPGALRLQKASGISVMVWGSQDKFLIDKEFRKWKNAGRKRPSNS